MLSVIYDDFYALQWFHCFHKKSYLFTFLPHFLPPKEIQLSRCDEFGLFISSNGLAAKLCCFDFSYFLRFVQVGRCFSSFSRCSIYAPFFDSSNIFKGIYFKIVFFQNLIYKTMTMIGKEQVQNVRYLNVLFKFRLFIFLILKCVSIFCCIIMK